MEPKPNRLIQEKSPYLLQHAYNPVDWHPWGREAFEKARREDKPLFLSIGYSTCHWCHVMEHESFEDPEVAGLLNQAFVCIKMDREERPDIDSVYMTACQAMGGGGGWPLTMILTPEGKPFLAGTYFPKEGRFGLMGMMDLVPRVWEAWTQRREEVLAAAEKVASALRLKPESRGVKEPGEDTLNIARDQLEQRFDTEHGGFGTAPKFPTPHNLIFLLRWWKRTGDEGALEMIEKTLQEMRRGGIYDQIGHGFHRYSTDARWLVPHFEKMLYDQALLALAYTEAYQATGRDEYRDTAEEALGYVLRDMTSPEGGFYSAEDADSEGEEGKFYLWTTQEVRQALGEEEAELFLKVFHAAPGGNFPDPHTGVRTGRNILHQMGPLSQSSEKLKLPEGVLRTRLEATRKKLFALREKRVHPGKDDKVLADWNGLMIAALAKAGWAFNEPRYAQAAGKAWDFIQERMLTSEGRLLHRFRDGEAAIPALTDDYAFLIWGLIELYEASFEPRYLRAAVDLNREFIAHFWDVNGGGFFFTPDDGERLIARQKELYDGALPSGNSVALCNLLRLSRLTGDSGLEAKAGQMVRTFSAQVGSSPTAYTMFLTGIDFAVGPSREVVIAGNPEAQDTQAMLAALRKRYLTREVILLRPLSHGETELVQSAPFTKDLTGLNGKATAYVCENHACQLPTTDIGKMLELLT